VEILKWECIHKLMVFSVIFSNLTVTVGLIIGNDKNNFNCKLN